MNWLTNDVYGPRRQETKDDTPRTTKERNRYSPEGSNSYYSAQTGSRLIKEDEPQRHETAKQGVHTSNAQKSGTPKDETDNTVVDMRKKVMRKSYKVTGYRVQVYAGGNSRNDRLKAEQTGNIDSR